MLFRLLGPLEVDDGTGPVPLGEGRRRAVLALLLLHRNEPVSTDRLVDALWGEAPPATAAKVLQNQVRALRRALGDREGRRLQTHGHAYALRIEAGELDADDFERLVGQGGDALADGRPGDAAERLREALALWRGPALADVAYEAFAQAEIARLEERRAVALERRIDADLALGRHADLVAELETLVAQHPLREHLRAQRMLALYRCGRQAEALEAFRDARRLLIDEVGVEPGAELRALHAAMLRQDPALVLPSTRPPPELDDTGAPPLEGRDRELAWLRERWMRARDGAGGLVVVTGAAGMGKSRLAAALAREARDGGASVLYVSGAAHPDALADALRRTREAGRETLVVVDDADASTGVRNVLREAAAEVAHRPVLVLVAAETSADLPDEDHIALGPLGAGAVRRIACGYAPAGRVDDAAAAALLEASAGVPAAVHELASVRARNEARRRVALSAPRTAAGRTELRMAEATLADGVVDLQVARARAERRADDAAPVVCPFKGLASFDAADAAYFFGRERLVAELVARSVGAPLVAVVGPSGSGKSSVTKAGLIPALADGVLPGSEAWRQSVIRPGQHPAAELRRAGAYGGRRERTVLVVDQFEEVFTACRDEDERAAFIDALTRAPEPAADLVVMALRADFYWRCAAYPALATLVGANHVLVGPMQRDELRRAIELPAQRAGLSVEPALVDALLADVEAEPGGLPLLSAALLELWQRRDGNEVRRATYELTGGVRGAVGRLAEDAYARMDATQQGVARSVLLRLAGEDATGVVVRRRLALTELESERDDDIARVLDLLTERRLVTMSATTAEVAHEALLREWPRLRGWLDEDAQGRRIRRRLADAAREWDERGRDPGDLYRGARLAVASEWRAGHERELNAVERAFLDTGRAVAERAHRRLQLALAGVAALLAVAVLGGVLALHQRGAARTEARIAEGQRISAQALTEGVLDRSLLFARQGVALADSPVTRGNLLTALFREPAATVVVQGEGQPLTAIDIGRDGRTVAVGARDGGVRLFAAATGRPLGRPLPTGPAVTAVRISPDGTRVAVIGDGQQGTGFIALFDARSHRRIGLLDYGFKAGLLADTGTVAFSPDSRVLIADYKPYAQPRDVRYVARWDGRTGRRLGPPRPVTSINDHERALGGFITAGTRIVTSSRAEDATAVRDAVSLRPLRRFAAGGLPADVSADGRTMALLSRDGAARLLDLHTGGLRPVGARGDARIVDMRLTPDGRRLVTVDERGRLAVRATSGDPRLTVVAPTAGRVARLAVAPDGRTAYTAGSDGAVIGWDVSGAPRLARPFRAGSGAPADLIAVRPTDATFAVPGERGEVELLDAGTLTRTARIALPAGADSLRAIAASPDGRTLAVATSGGAVAFADVPTGRLRAPPSAAHAGAVLGLAYSPDARWLASSGEDGSIYVWDARRAKPVRLFVDLSGDATSLSVSPDGSKLAATVVHPDGTGEVDILRMPRPALVSRSPALVGTQSQFSRDGRLLFYADRTGRVWTLDTRTWAPQGPPLGVPGDAGRFALSPDDRVIAITRGDGRTQLWDVASRRPIGAALPGVAGPETRAAFVDGGHALVTLGRGGRGYVWDVDPRSWARRACAVAGRTLTRAEWRAALPGRDYAPACRRG